MKVITKLWLGLAVLVVLVGLGYFQSQRYSPRRPDFEGTHRRILDIK